jgi:HEAT repeat protein
MMNGETAFCRTTSDCGRSENMGSHQPPDLDRLVYQLDDSDPLVRQEAAISIGDFCRIDHPCIDLLIERLQSPEQSFHDRACASWSLGRIKARAEEVMPILLSLIEETKDQPLADELRRFAVEAVERLTDDSDVLTTVARQCVHDRAWECRMKGLFILERLLKRQPELREGLVPLLEVLVSDEVEEIRERARRILMGFEEGE